MFRWDASARGTRTTIRVENTRRSNELAISLSGGRDGRMLWSYCPRILEKSGELFASVRYSGIVRIRSQNGCRECSAETANSSTSFFRSICVKGFGFILVLTARTESGTGLMLSWNLSVFLFPIINGTRVVYRYSSVVGKTARFRHAAFGAV